MATAPAPAAATGRKTGGNRGTGKALLVVNKFRIKEQPLLNKLTSYMDAAAKTRVLRELGQKKVPVLQALESTAILEALLNKIETLEAAARPAPPPMGLGLPAPAPALISPRSKRKRVDLVEQFCDADHAIIKRALNLDSQKCPAYFTADQWHWVQNLTMAYITLKKQSPLSGDGKRLDDLNSATAWWIRRIGDLGLWGAITIDVLEDVSQCACRF